MPVKGGWIFWGRDRVVTKMVDEIEFILKILKSYECVWVFNSKVWVRWWLMSFSLERISVFFRIWRQLQNQSVGVLVLTFLWLTQKKTALESWTYSPSWESWLKPGIPVWRSADTKYELVFCVLPPGTQSYISDGWIRMSYVHLLLELFQGSSSSSQFFKNFHDLGVS